MIAWVLWANRWGKVHIDVISPPNWVSCVIFVNNKRITAQEVGRLAASHRAIEAATLYAGGRVREGSKALVQKRSEEESMVARLCRTSGVYSRKIDGWLPGDCRGCAQMLVK